MGNKGRNNSGRSVLKTNETVSSYVPEILHTLSIDDHEVKFTERIVYKFPNLGKKIFTKFALEGPYQDWTNTFKRSTVHWDKSKEILNPDKEKVMTERFASTDRCCGNFYPTSHSKSPSRHVIRCSGEAHNHKFIGEVNDPWDNKSGNKTYLS